MGTSWPVRDRELWLRRSLLGVGLIFRKSLHGPRGTRVNVSRSGVSVSKRLGPFTLSSRGHLTLRIWPGVSWRIF